MSISDLTTDHSVYSVYQSLPEILAAFPLSEMATGYPTVPVALLLNLKGGNPFSILQPAVELAQCGFTAVASIDSLNEVSEIRFRLRT